MLLKSIIFALVGLLVGLAAGWAIALAWIKILTGMNTHLDRTYVSYVSNICTLIGPAVGAGIGLLCAFIPKVSKDWDAGNPRPVFQLGGTVCLVSGIALALSNLNSTPGEHLYYLVNGLNLIILGVALLTAEVKFGENRRLEFPLGFRRLSFVVGILVLCALVIGVILGTPDRTWGTVATICWAGLLIKLRRLLKG